MAAISIVLTLIIVSTILLLAVIARWLGKAMALDLPFKVYVWIAILTYLVMGVIFKSYGAQW